MTGGVGLAQLEQRLGHVFRDKALLERALTTPACRMDHPELPDNQRLEFLGDAVFGLLSADAVFAAYPDEQEGPLTVRRTHLVSGAMLAKVAERMGLRDHLRRNKGASPLPPRAKPLSDAMEAVMGAVWLDGGLSAAQTVFDHLALPLNAPLNEWSQNPKGALQQYAQGTCHVSPVYQTVASSLQPPHFEVEVKVQNLVARGAGGSKKAAEIAAARAALELLRTAPEEIPESSQEII